MINNQNANEQAKTELKHFGVLGMKWGIRKERETTYSPTTKKEQFTLKKGTTIHRLSTKADETHAGHAYATFKPKDTQRYMRRSLLFRQKSFDMTMKATKDLVSPSQKTRVDEFISLISKDKEFSSNLANAMKNMKIVKSEEKYKDILDRMTEAELRTRAYNDFSLSLAFDQTVRDKYFKELSNKGYNMIIDDMDAQLLSDSPIIIFDRGKTLEVTSVDPVTRQSLKTLKSRR